MAYHIDELHPGMSASTSKTVTEADIILFAGISTDVNPAAPAATGFGSSEGSRIRRRGRGVAMRVTSELVLNEVA